MILPPISTAPYRFKGIHQCDALVIMPLSFNFNREAISCVEHSYDVRAFDLFGISSLDKRLAQESETVMNTFQLATEIHKASTVFDIRHVDFHGGGKSTRFSTQKEEDDFNTTALLSSRKKVLECYKNVKRYVMLYAYLVNDRTEIEFCEIMPDGTRRVRAVYPFRFRDVFTCRVALLICMDFRFRREMRGYTRYNLKEDVFDMFPIPGATRRLIKGSPTAWKNLQLLYDKHGCRKLIAIHHEDCGDYEEIFKKKGIIKPTPEQQETVHKSDLRTFREILGKRLPEMELVTSYASLIENQEIIQFEAFL